MKSVRRENTSRNMQGQYPLTSRRRLTYGLEFFTSALFDARGVGKGGYLEVSPWKNGGEKQLAGHLICPRLQLADFLEEKRVPLLDERKG